MTTFTRPSSLLRWAWSALGRTTRTVEPSAGTKQDGFEPSQIVTRQQLNWVLNRLFNDLGWLYAGQDADGNPSGAMLTHTSLESFCASAETDRVGAVTDPGEYQGAYVEAATTDIAHVWTDGDAVYWVGAYVGPTPYGSLRRATMEADADLDWTREIADGTLAIKPVGITGDGTYLYLLVSDYNIARIGYIWKLERSSGALVSSVTLNPALTHTPPGTVYEPLKIICNGQYIAVHNINEVMVYDTNLTYLWRNAVSSADITDICFTPSGLLIVASETGGGGDNVVAFNMAGSNVYSNGDLTAEDVAAVFCDGRSVYAIASITGSANIVQMDQSLNTIASHEHASSPLAIFGDGRYVFVAGVESGTDYIYQHLGTSQGPLLWKLAVADRLAYDCDGVSIFVASDGGGNEARRYWLGEEARIYRRKDPASATGPWNKLAVPG